MLWERLARSSWTSGLQALRVSLREAAREALMEDLRETLREALGTTCLVLLEFQVGGSEGHSEGASG